MRAISRIRYPRGGTRTGKALRYTWNRMLRQNRRRVRKVVVLITDGRSEDRVGNVARTLRKAGIEINAVGIGRRYNLKQLRMIATDSRHVITSGFRTIGNLIRTIKYRICRGDCHLFFTTNS